MFRKRYMKVITSGEENIDSLMRLAANHNLSCLYKIGVYGKERQHELYVDGYPWDYHAFIKEAKPLL